MLPSFYLSPDKRQVWSVIRAAIFGAGIGLVAALVKTLGPAFIGTRAPANVIASLLEIAAATGAFALLCAAAALLRNFLVLRLD
jgi:hypothetical protein